jgi:DNA-binding response OmpR family regulator
MPVMDGITLVEQIRYLDGAVASVPIITASGNADEDMRRDSLAVGSNIFMTKPFDLRVLAREIATLLKGSRRPGPREHLNDSAVGGNRIDQGLKINS